MFILGWIVGSNQIRNTNIFEDIKDIELLVRNAASLPMDDIWVHYESVSEYPCLSILINGVLACVHYFESSELMWQSKGDYDTEIIFSAGGEEWCAPTDTIISIESAIKCLYEFCSNMKRPECIQWQEL